MEIVSQYIADLNEFGKSCDCEVHCIHIKIRNIESKAQELLQTINNTSWLSDLRIVARTTFEARCRRTIDSMTNAIKDREDDEMTEEFGEYLISFTAQSSLFRVLDHTIVPLAEFLKEKVVGNPGFDFHTETHREHIAFGEAKYSGSDNKHIIALQQISRFIDLDKDSAELLVLEDFVSPNSVDNFLNEKKAYVAAFSINSPNPQTIIKNAIKLSHIDPLLKYPEIYVIGVEIDA